MMWFVVTVIVSIVAVELFFRLPVQTSVIVLLDKFRSVTNIMRLQHASDHWKEKAMLGYSVRIAKVSLRLAAFLAVIVGICSVLMMLANQFLTSSESIFDYVASPIGIVVATASAIAYAYVRQQLAE